VFAAHEKLQEKEGEKSIEESFCKKKHIGAVMQQCSSNTP
jgi:hypothetical protein